MGSNVDLRIIAIAVAISLLVGTGSGYIYGHSPIAELEEEVNFMQERVLNITDQLGQLSTETKDNVGRLEMEKLELQSQNEQLKDQLTEAEKDLSSTQSSLQSLQANYEILEEDYKLLKENYEVLIGEEDIGEEEIDEEESYEGWCEIGVPYEAVDGLTVTLIDLTINEKIGSYQYKISYILKNEQPDRAIDEGSFKMYYASESGGLPQYGFFGNLFPGDAVPRTYTFEELKNKPFGILAYHPEQFFSSDPLEDSLKWKVEIP